MKSSLQELASLDRLIHEPSRLMIISLLFAAKEADFLYLLRESGLTQGNLSSHLSRLEAAGYIEIEKKFKGKYPLTVCKLTQNGRKAFENYTRKMRAISKL
jgi:DNA-binding transcriptional ArsR family regulator